MSFTLIIRKKFYKMNEIFYNILYQLMENYAMKRFLELLKDRANEFFNDKTSRPAPLEDDKIIQIIELALRKKQGVHVIFQNKSFTGDIVKYDQERKQLIVKNFKKSMSTIIRISDIQKISLVPHTIRIAQQKTP